jgi:3-deoxy-manno-octulosonate cytidylyltransferase (CMP-KDO synthetase)
MTTSADFVVAIPARYAASRLPGKPLRMLGGEPLVLHVARRALAAGAREVWVATDDARIADALAGSGVRIAMTAADHVSGTDRLAECARIAGWEPDTVVVNLQGDEPFAPASGIRAVAEILIASGAPMSTLATPIEDAATLFDPNAVKLVRAASGDALYFSRAPIPWARDAFASDRHRLPASLPALRHVGLYAYRAGFLARYPGLPRAPIEEQESLEQLRALWHGEGIAVLALQSPLPPGVDTAEDLAHVRGLLASGSP